MFFLFIQQPIRIEISAMGWNADIDNEELNEKTDNSTILYQASVFNKYCRVFAPRYRQANLQAFFTSDKLKGGSP